RVRLCTSSLLTPAHFSPSSVRVSWDLVCAQYWLVPVEEVCFILGVLTGCLGLGYALPVVGLWICVCCAVGGCGVGCFWALRGQKHESECVAGCCVGVTLTCCVALSGLELCEPSLRLVVTMLAGLMTVAGELLLLAVALGCQSWRGLLGAGAAPLTLFLSYGYEPASTRVRASSSVFNGSQTDPLLRPVSAELDSEPAPSSRPHLSFPELFHSRNIWKNMCVLGFTSFISHGISHCYSSFRGDVRGTAPSFYWTYLLSVCAGGGAWLLLWATVDRCGRRGILLLAMTMTGLASLILLGLMEYLSETAITVFSVLGLFSSQATASLCILFTAEVMPTIIRGTGVGAVLALGCVGRLSSPLMDLRNHYGYFLHHVIYSSLALLAVLSILLLPESKRKPLPQTLADGEQYRRPPLGRRRRDNVPLLATPNPET
uniref:Solute carrier family 22 member 17 n=1 Tax=Stegastes partitus TaxID=144197 RepID=A0A3B5BEX2_9TELE